MAATLSLGGEPPKNGKNCNHTFHILPWKLHSSILTTSRVTTKSQGAFDSLYWQCSSEPVCSLPQCLSCEQKVREQTAVSMTRLTLIWKRNIKHCHIAPNKIIRYIRKISKCIHPPFEIHTKKNSLRYLVKAASKFFEKQWWERNLMETSLLVLSRDVILCTIVPAVSIDRRLRVGITCWKSQDATWCRFTQLLEQESKLQIDSKPKLNDWWRPNILKLSSRSIQDKEWFELMSLLQVETYTHQQGH